MEGGGTWTAATAAASTSHHGGGPTRQRATPTFASPRSIGRGALPLPSKFWGANDLARDPPPPRPTSHSSPRLAGGPLLLYPAPTMELTGPVRPRAACDSAMPSPHRDIHLPFSSAAMATCSGPRQRPWWGGRQRSRAHATTAPNPIQLPSSSPPSSSAVVAARPLRVQFSCHGVAVAAGHRPPGLHPTTTTSFAIPPHSNNGSEVLHHESGARTGSAAPGTRDSAPGAIRQGWENHSR
ncbi:hypothetical protein VPH35_043169 [Triticum aestivum]